MANCEDKKLIKVAVAVIARGTEILVSKRPAHVDQGGLWEFPGGKVEAHEDTWQALQRECREELAIEVRHGQPLITIPHEYPNYHVLLDVYRVSAFKGEPCGAEGQVVRWLAKEALVDLTFPAANRGIVTAVQLPDFYFISPTPADYCSTTDYLAQLENIICRQKLQLMRFRAPALSLFDYQDLLKQVVALCRRYHCRCLADYRPELLLQNLADGYHLSDNNLHQLRLKPELAPEQWLAASVHDETSLQQALNPNLALDFMTISPVKATASHPDAMSLGFDHFARLTAQSALPVYALGGMRQEDLKTVQGLGGQGIAAIRGFYG